MVSSSSILISKSDKHQLASSNFNKYDGDNDKDYDNVFGKLNRSYVCFLLHAAR